MLRGERPRTPSHRRRARRAQVTTTSPRTSPAVVDVGARGSTLTVLRLRSRLRRERISSSRHTTTKHRTVRACPSRTSAHPGSGCRSLSRPVRTPWKAAGVITRARTPARSAPGPLTRGPRRSTRAPPTASGRQPSTAARAARASNPTAVLNTIRCTPGTALAPSGGPGPGPRGGEQTRAGAGGAVTGSGGDERCHELGRCDDRDERPAQLRGLPDGGRSPGPDPQQRHPAPKAKNPRVGRCPPGAARCVRRPADRHRARSQARTRPGDAGGVALALFAAGRPDAVRDGVHAQVGEFAAAAPLRPPPRCSTPTRWG
ncbi:hypothetical protein CLV37_11839 [Kineococcus rhizosphaerae]|uniref:Uncharacterized protein n=1 Tax=Kineococcus rhizosphaerae TaxID=559628 RepID=A0A2T0QWW8_9ACTN|nr:hypothetical protein CLV37_11839 [Kineococcus rhizosphaerae]